MLISPGEMIRVSNRPNDFTLMTSLNNQSVRNSSCRDQLLFLVCEKQSLLGLASLLSLWAGDSFTTCDIYLCVALLARQQGTWGLEHARRVVDWADHLGRPRNSGSLAARLFSWKDARWLQTQRLDPDVGGHGRPGTRVCSGPVCARWDESIALARAKLMREL